MHNSDSVRKLASDVGHPQVSTARSHPIEGLNLPDVTVLAQLASCVGGSS
jgi:hypothetical protein